MPNPFFLAIFPDLLLYSDMGPFLLRVVIGLIFIDLGILKFKAEKARWIASLEAVNLRPASTFVAIYGALQILGGFLLIIGLWTQAAALAFVIFTGIESYFEWKEEALLKRNFVFYGLLFTISLALLLMGPGSFSIDMPL